MLDITNVISIFIIGLIVGSFLNVCIYRLPHNKSIIASPSHCLSCSTRLRALDLIPVFSCLLSGARCRYCGARFSWRYLVVEILTGLVFVCCLAAEGIAEFLPELLVFASFMVVITFIDIDHQLILNKVLLWLGIAGILFNVFRSAASIAEVLWAMLCSILLGGGIMLAIIFVSGGEGMGGGDMKFAAILGVWLDWKLLLLTLLLAFAMGGIVGLSLLLMRLVGRKDGAFRLVHILL